MLKFWLHRAPRHANRSIVAATRKQTPKSPPKQSRQAEIDEVPFLDRFHISVTGFPFPLGPFFQRRTVRKEVRVTDTNTFCSHNQSNATHQVHQHARCMWLVPCVTDSTSWQCKSCTAYAVMNVCRLTKASCGCLSKSNLLVAAM